MVRVKDEARFLPEWLAHHTTMGFEHVVIYDNNSTDDLAGAVAPFVERGLVTVVPWPTVPASPGAHLDFLRRFGPTCDWTAFFDADEFLVERRPGDLARTLAAARGPAVAVNWRYYGGAGHETVPRGLLTGRFDRAAPVLNHHVKVIARPREVVGYRNSHNFYYRRRRGWPARRTGGGCSGRSRAPPTRPRWCSTTTCTAAARTTSARRGTASSTRSAPETGLGRPSVPRWSSASTTTCTHRCRPQSSPRPAARLAELGYPDELWQAEAHDTAAPPPAG